MTRKKKVIIITVQIVVASILIGLISLTSGCSHNESKETLRIYEDRVEYTSKVSQGLFLYFTTTKQISKTTPLTELTVGEIDSEPDPNSISSVGGALGAAIKMIK